MRDGDGFEKANTDANDTKTATLKGRFTSKENGRDNKTGHAGAPGLFTGM